MCSVIKNKEMWYVMTNKDVQCSTLKSIHLSSIRQQVLNLHTFQVQNLQKHLQQCKKEPKGKLGIAKKIIIKTWAKCFPVTNSRRVARVWKSSAKALETTTTHNSSKPNLEPPSIAVAQLPGSMYPKATKSRGRDIYFTIELELSVLLPISPLALGSTIFNPFTSN